MAVISGADYLKIATEYATARDAIVSSTQYLFDAVYDVVILQEILPEVDLLNEFYNSYQVNTNIYKSPVTMLSAVRALNNHVLNRKSSEDDYTTIGDTSEGEGDGYISTKVPGGKVPSGWADLCRAAGYVVQNDLIS